MKLRIAILLSFLTPLSALADNVCRIPMLVNTAQSSLGKIDFTRMNRDLSFMAAQENLKEFCEWNRLGRTAGIRKNLVRDASAKDDKQAAVQVIKDNFYGDSPWQFSMYGEASLKALALKYSHVSNEANQPASFHEISEVFAKPFPKKDQLPTPKYSLIKEVEITNEQKLGACFYLNAFNTPSCVSGLGIVEKEMALYDSGMNNRVAPQKPFARAVADSSLTEGLRLVVTKMMSQLESGKSSQSNLYDEVLSSFKESGLEATAAEDATWDVLAALANTGPNMGNRFPAYDYTHLKKDPYNPNALALTIIAEAIPFLDTLTISEKQPRLYSLPSNADFPCDAGKSYHFWMAAYLTRQMVKQGISPEGARAAAYASQVGYQLNRSEGAGGVKETDMGILGYARYGETENGVRIDLTLAGAGTRFGADIAQKKKPHKLDLKNTLVNGIKEGGVVKAQENPKSYFLNDAMSYYKQWADNLNPKFFFSSF